MGHLFLFVLALGSLSNSGSASRVDYEGGWPGSGLFSKFSNSAIGRRVSFERAYRGWHVDTPQMLETPLVAAKFCKASYGDRSVVETAVVSAGFTLRKHTDRWWIAARPDGEVYVVFRGTADLKDVIADIQVKPILYNGAMWHSGFLKAAQEPHLQHALRRHADSQHVTLIGHSLGGSIAYALAASGLMPVGHIREVITFGAPPVIFASSSHLVRHNFQHTAFVHESDPVPRILGSEAKDIHRFFRLSKEEPDPALLESLSQYQQQGDVTWLKNGRPLQVPEVSKSLVMQLQLTFNFDNPFANPLNDHLIGGYRGDIEQAIASPE